MSPKLCHFDRKKRDIELIQEAKESSMRTQTKVLPKFPAAIANPDSEQLP